MKTLLKLGLLFFIFVLLILAAAVFTLTRPGVQKILIERQLPAGSSIGKVAVTASRVSISQLNLVHPNGASVRIEQLQTGYSPSAALFDRTIRLGDLRVEGVLVELASPLLEPAAAPAGPLPATGSGGAPAPERATNVDTARAATPAAPLDPIYALGQIDWLLDIASVSVSGELRDGAGSVFLFELSSEAIRPGERATLEGSFRLDSAESLTAGIQQLDTSARLQLLQKSGGGFEELDLEAIVAARDRMGRQLLSAKGQVGMTVQSFQKTAGLKVAFNAEVPQPVVFVPELAGFSELGIQAAFGVSARGPLMTVETAEFLASAGERALARVNLKQTFPLGAGPALAGDLMDVELLDLPWSLISPLLPEGLVVAGEPLRARFNLQGEAAGQFRVSSIVPLVVGPVSVSWEGQPMLDRVTLQAQPVLRVGGSSPLSWDLGPLRLSDRYGDLIAGTSTGDWSPAASILDALRMRTDLELGLLELSQQPVLVHRWSLLTGRARILVESTPGESHPLQVQGRLSGLSARDFPGQRQDYRFAMQLRQPDAGVLGFGLSLQAGSSERPSTVGQLSGRLTTASEPLRFSLEMAGQQISQRDIDLLAAAFRPRETAPTAAGLPEPEARAGRFPAGSAGTLSPPVAESVPPAWSGVDGRFDLSVDRVLLNSGQSLEALKLAGSVNEALLEVTELAGRIGEGQLTGAGRVRFDPAAARGAYQLEAKAELSGIDPSMFASGPAASFPVRGQFDGDLTVVGRGRSLGAALDAAEGELEINGREGLLTAFELNQGSQLGLVGAGLLGQSLNRPGLSALARAVPFFQNMPFESFVLKLSRGVDRNVLVPRLEFRGPHVLIEGRGFIAATSPRQVLDQPLDLTLSLGARGPLVEHLETLQLLGLETTEDGFRRWSSSIKIGGTLGRPDTSALERLLNEAARRALSRAAPSPAAETSPPSSAPLGESLAPPPPARGREQRILEDIGTGLDLLNSIMGQ